jgi:hypothetical protein
MKRQMTLKEFTAYVIAKLGVVAYRKEYRGCTIFRDGYGMMVARYQRGDGWVEGGDGLTQYCGYTFKEHRILLMKKAEARADNRFIHYGQLIRDGGCTMGSVAKRYWTTEGMQLRHCIKMFGLPKRPKWVGASAKDVYFKWEITGDDPNVYKVMCDFLMDHGFNASWKEGMSNGWRVVDTSTLDQWGRPTQARVQFPTMMIRVKG